MRILTHPCFWCTNGLHFSAFHWGSNHYTMGTFPLICSSNSPHCTFIGPHCMAKQGFDDDYYCSLPFWHLMLIPLSHGLDTFKLMQNIRGNAFRCMRQGMTSCVLFCFGNCLLNCLSLAYRRRKEVGTT